MADLKGTCCLYDLYYLYVTLFDVAYWDLHNVVIFTDSMLKSLRMREFNKNLNGGITHLKLFPGSKAKQMDHHVIPILKEHQYDVAVIHVGIY